MDVNIPFLLSLSFLFLSLFFFLSSSSLPSLPAVLGLDPASPDQK